MKTTLKQLAKALAATDTDNIKGSGKDYDALEYYNQLKYDGMARHFVRAYGWLKEKDNAI